MFEYSSSVRGKSVLAKLAGLLLLLVILLRILSSFVNTEKAFWACFLVWGVLSLIESLSSRKAEKSAGAEISHAGASQGEPELPIWWKAFGPLAAFNFITIFLGLGLSEASAFCCGSSAGLFMISLSRVGWVDAD